MIARATPTAATEESLWWCPSIHTSIGWGFRALDEQPPNFYRLLGVVPLILILWRSSRHPTGSRYALARYQAGPQGEGQQLLSEIARRHCSWTPSRRPLTTNICKEFAAR